MQLLDDHLFQYYKEGKITKAEMLDKARSPGELQDRIMGKARKEDEEKKQNGDDDNETILRN
jgi:Tfp pilus assembly ATPase PilU